MTNLSFRITGATHEGLVRTNNEDNFIINANLSEDNWFIPSNTDQDIELSDAGCLFVVADGMGGMNAGEVASAIAVETIRELFTREEFESITETDQDIELFMNQAIVQADEKIKNHVAEDPSTEGMGTTIVMAWVVKGKVHISWCGDSRAYLFNPKFGIVRLSKDHSYVQQLVDENKLDAESAFDHPDSNIITRSLGDSRTKAAPDYMSRRLSAGDQILLCSDGLCGLCRDEEIAEQLTQKYSSIEQLKVRLLNRALEAGGFDNITVVLFQVANQDDVCEGMRNTARVKVLPMRKRILRIVGIVIGVVFMIITAVFLVWRLLGKEHTDSVPKNPEQEQTIVAPNPNNNQEIENLHNQLRAAEQELDKLNSQGPDSNPPTTNNKTTGDKKGVQGASGGKDNKSESEAKTGSQEPAKDTKVEEKGGKDNAAPKSGSETKKGSQESIKGADAEGNSGNSTDSTSNSKSKKGNGSDKNKQRDTKK